MSRFPDEGEDTDVAVEVQAVIGLNAVMSRAYQHGSYFTASAVKTLNSRNSVILILFL